MAIFYVAPAADGGSDAAAGTYLAPKATVGGAQTAATTGDTVVLKTSANYHSTATLTFTKNLTIEGESTNPADQVFDGGASSIRWSTATASHQLITKYATFQNAYWRFPFYLTGTSAVWDFQTCKFDLQLDSASYAGLFLMSATNAKFITRNCKIKNLSAYAGSAERYVAYESGGYATLFEDYGSTFYLPSGLSYVFKAVNNSITATLKNSVFYGIGAIPYKTGTVTTTPTTCFFHNITSPPAGITSDPLFVDAVNDNFNLQPGSPCIGAGTP